MKNYDGFDVFIGVLIGIILGLFLWCALVFGTYKDGQIDALTGKIGYRLVTKPDSSRVWEKK